MEKHDIEEHINRYGSALNEIFDRLYILERMISRLLKDRPDIIRHVADMAKKENANRITTGNYIEYLSTIHSRFEKEK